MKNTFPHVESDVTPEHFAVKANQLIVKDKIVQRVKLNEKIIN